MRPSASRRLREDGRAAPCSDGERPVKAANEGGGATLKQEEGRGKASERNATTVAKSVIPPTVCVFITAGPTHRSQQFARSRELEKFRKWGTCVQAFAAATGVDAICIDPMNASLVR